MWRLASVNVLNSAERTCGAQQFYETRIRSALQYRDMQLRAQVFSEEQMN